MAAETSARLSSTHLRRRMHILERASRSFTTAESSTRSGDLDDADDDMQPLPSPPTSHDYHFDDDDDDEEEHASGSDEAGIPTAAPFYPDALYEPPPPSSWYRPSYTVLLALAPPIANWLTGGDHLKDLLLLLLLVFYLHQLVEVPWNLYHAARPRRLPASAVPSAPPPMAIRAQSELRRLEFFLLFICFIAPLLGVCLLRSLVTGTTASPTPISWFSTSIFALLTGLRPLRELTARIASRTSILHTQAHAYTAPPPPPKVPDAQVAALTARVATLEAAVARLTQREEALYAYVEDALTPLEKGMRRVERRVGKLRAARKAEQEQDPSSPLTPGGSTIFVPAQRKSLLTTWLASPTVPVRSAPPPPVLVPSPKVQMQSPRRLHLDSIPEESEYAAASTVASTSRTLPPAYSAPAPTPVSLRAPAPAKSPVLTREAVLALVPSTPAAVGRALVVLALWPLWLVLWPIRMGLRYLVGALG